MDNKQLAQGIASLGRYGDTTLMHMRPEEVSQLQAISRAGGGDITINPDTGMPEAFLGDFFSALAPTAAGLIAGSVFPPAYAPYLAAGAGGLTAYAQGKRDPLGIAMGALGGYGGGTIGQNLVAQGAPAVPAGSAESTFMPTDTTIGGANLTTNATGAVGATGTTGQVGGANLTTAGAKGFGSQPTQVYNPRINTTLGPNMSRAQPVFKETPYQSDFGDANFGNNISNAPQPTYMQTPPAPERLYDMTGTPSINVNELPPLTETTKSPFQQGFEYGQGQLGKLGSGIKNVFTDEKARGEFFGRMGGAKYDDYGNLVEKGNETYGMFRTGLPIAGAGLEAYAKGMYEDMPTYEASTAGRYDPTRRLNLGMDTGLRLLAGGGSVKRYQTGGNIMGNPVTTPSPYLQQIGMFPGGGAAPEEYGIVDVSGNFVKTSDKPGQGLMSKTSYYDTYKFKEEGYTPEKQEDSSGDFESKAGLQSGVGGINPTVALQAAQGYASQQQSDLNQQGLGGLRSGGAIKYQQGGKTTAEQNTVKTATPPPVTTMDLMLAKKNQEDVNQQGLPAGLNLQSLQAAQEQQGGMAGGGIAELTPENGTMLSGDGDGVSDDIAANIEGEQEAALSDGEFIVPARIVSELGNGSSDAGAKKLYEMIDRIQAARSQTMGNKKEYAKDTNAERYLPA